ncbi:MAG TPA: hypothetical protein VE959_26245 [Bryobacteraceae bacterium]|nr:hypothetical protein [Bryobacteraceae bacterium]
MEMTKAFIAPWLWTAALLAQPAPPSAQNPASIVLGNDKLELTIGTTGARFSRLLIRGGEPLSPFATIGHFLALDGFGAPSDEERAAGMPFHGEANRISAKVIARQDSGPVRSVSLQLWLPLAQETLTRTVEMADGENVVYVTSELESALAVDRPVSWTEHATLGPPFLEPGKVTIDMPATRCRVRAYKAGSTGKLAYLKDFDWPMAPLTAGGFVNLLTVPVGETSLDLATCLMDPARKYAYVTAVRTDKQLIFGYVFHREEYPWLMNWMNYTGDARAARGVEFSTLPFDVPHRETVDTHEMFGAPTYKWLPAKSKIRTRFVFFYCPVPSGFTQVSDVLVEDGQVKIQDKSGKIVVLNARLPL